MFHKPIIICALKEEFYSSKYADITHYTGIGKVGAAITTMRAILKNNADLVINVGTAGSNRGLSGGIECVKFLDRDTEPSDQISTGSEGGVCSTGDRFLTEPDLRADVSDMEAYAIARACLREGVKFRCFKYVTDHVSADCNKDWQKNIGNGQEFFMEQLELILGR